MGGNALAVEAALFVGRGAASRYTAAAAAEFPVVQGTRSATI